MDNCFRTIYVLFCQIFAFGRWRSKLYFAGVVGEVSLINAHILRLCVIVVVVVVAR